MINILLSTLSGLLLALLFPKFSLYYLAWIALIPLLISIHRSKSSRDAGLNGLVCGAVFFLINLYWITTLSEFAGFWAYLGWITLAIYEAIFILLFAYFSKTFIKKSVILPSLIWLFFEWLRSLGSFGVSAGGLGYSQAKMLPLIQIAEFTTVYGISFLIVLVNTTLFSVVQSFSSANKHDKYLAGLKTCTTLLLILLVCFYGVFELRGNREFHSQVPEPTLKLALIQGNIDQKTKLNPAKIGQTFKIYEELSRRTIKEKPDIIIWPETTVFTYLLQNNYYLSKIKQLVQEANSYLIVGTAYREDKDTIYNSAVLFSPKGEVIGRYDKEHLVAFGEYLPLRPLLYPLVKGTGFFEADFKGNPQGQLLVADKLKIGVGICFESTFVHLLKDKANQGADLLVTITNDAWFNDSSALYEHINCGVFRAIENRKYFIQVGNTGISAVIDPYGRILAKTRVNEQKVLTFQIPLP